MPSNTTPPMLKAVILVGGPSKGTRFRPLSLYCPKPLFPIAGEPLFIHHIHALARIPSLQDIYLIGFFEEHSFAPYLDSIHQSYPKLRVRYLREYQPLGTAGGLYHFRDELLKYQTQYLVVLHADMCAHVDLSHLLTWHLTYRATCPDLLATLLAVQVPKASTHCYGCMVIQPHPLEKEEKKEEEEEEEGLEGWHGGSVVHYVEKPDFFLSDYVNAGMYVFDQAIFKYLEHWKPMKRVEDLRGSMKSVFTSFLETHSSVTPPVSSSSSSTKPLSVSTDQLWFEYDVFKQLAGTKKLAAVVPPNPVWFPLKNAVSVTEANSVMLKVLASVKPETLAKPEDGGPKIIGNVYVHPSAEIHPTAKLGPSVSIGARVILRSGVRISHSVILDGTEIMDNACVRYSVIGWHSKIGQWTRVEGTPPWSINDSHETLPELDTQLIKNGQKTKTATVLGHEVTLANEIIVNNCIVLPHKTLGSSHRNDILM